MQIPDKHLPRLRQTFWLTRIVLLRFLAFIYLVAFLCAAFQNRGLLGRDGLLPAYLEVERRKPGLESLGGGTLSLSVMWERFKRFPCLFQFLPDDIGLTDNLLDGPAWVGAFLSALVFWKGSGHWTVLLSLWVLYHTLVNVGQRWYSFGWESQLLESGFLAIFLSSPFLSSRTLLDFSQMPSLWPPLQSVIWGYRWLLFRIMIGAGLIKLRGDQCWRDLTCMNYHYETQPNPNPLAWFFHNNLEQFHWFETFTNHIVEILLPALLLIPLRQCRLLGGCVQMGFQLVLISSGNLSFLNWLTILPALACFDDAFLLPLFRSTRVRDSLVAVVCKESPQEDRHRGTRGGGAKGAEKVEENTDTQSAEEEEGAEETAESREGGGPARVAVLAGSASTGVGNALRKRRAEKLSEEVAAMEKRASPNREEGNEDHGDSQAKHRRRVKPDSQRGLFSLLCRFFAFLLRVSVELSLVFLIGRLSSPVVSNLLSQRQAMNTSFDSFRLVNTYGAFGSITKERNEVIVEGTASDNPNSPDSQWYEIEFKCKPGDVRRAPCLISPYHLRLDWLMWFAAFQNWRVNPWLPHLAYKLIKNEAAVLPLLAPNPFPEGRPPRFVRASHYRYRFTSWKDGNPLLTGVWWKRERLPYLYMPPLGERDILPILNQFGWKQYR
uniref:Lipase maturation factor n=1 Tax=Chromera velia CCMP2878 TaxID=1169474 RepID=A0A0G4HCZ6_9ALVE|eukprot:Cvel_26329.t1-p1 / transcript=Cvel_26329.t1 / gene=Cvel_26329 / organism=Chromera_velia_CCMP2878 / gene_product=Lipase maturation factor 1, putative / transcript_product=Lipase maturation factor 1, putative / location=Cvel_scaffold3114:7539-14545(+) / protein_length=663 / sequence_SO=supercontig / SO=protein_coding / is_pseudo=false